MDNPYNCVICWKRFTQPVVLNCGHTFDKHCLDSITTCPICRENILTRSTNWQVLQIIESRQKEGPLPGKSDSSDEEVNFEEQYRKVTTWADVKTGTRLKYTIGKGKKPTSHYGWFRRFDLEQQIVEIYFHDRKTVRLPTEYIREAWSLQEERIEFGSACCCIF